MSAASYGERERKAEKIGSLGSISILISAIGGGTNREAGSTTKQPKKRKKARRPPTPKETSEVANMLRGAYKEKLRRTSEA